MLECYGISILHRYNLLGALLIAYCFYDVKKSSGHAEIRSHESQESHETRRDDLLAHLHRKEKILAKEEEWLDNAANPVDEEAVVVLLENASDYEHRLTRLNSQQKSLVEKLKELSEKVVLAGRKRKSTRCIFPTKIMS